MIRFRSRLISRRSGAAKGVFSARGTRSPGTPDEGIAAEVLDRDRMIAGGARPNDEDPTAEAMGSRVDRSVALIYGREGEISAPGSPSSSSSRITKPVAPAVITAGTMYCGLSHQAMTQARQRSSAR